MPHDTRRKECDATESKSCQREARRNQRLRNAMWRDFLFVVVGGVALHIVGFVETHASDADIRGGGINAVVVESILPVNGTYGSIVDAGFILTAPLYRFLMHHRKWNDIFACINSLALIIPTCYAATVTLWHGDYTLSFRLIATQLFRSLCGWLTYLPPSEEFLMSIYDFPEVAQCLFRDCSDISSGQHSSTGALPFVSFFSGHVATCVIAANHMYIHGYVKSSLALHSLNVFQIIRLLATRGHYSIDIIIGWCVAVFMSNQWSNPAERFGKYYSNYHFLAEMFPSNATDAFETVTGVHQEPRQNGIIQSDTTARIAVEAASDFAKRSLSGLQEEVSDFGLHMNEIKELRRNDLIRLLRLTQLKLEELRFQAKLLDLNITEGESRADLILVMMRQLKQAIENKLPVRGVSEEE